MSVKSVVPFLLRGFLRLLVLVTPLFVLFVRPRRGPPPGHVARSENRCRERRPSAVPRSRPGREPTLQVEAHIRYVVEHASVGLWVVSLLPALVLALAVSTVALLLLRTDATRPTPVARSREHGVRRLRLVAAVRRRSRRSPSRC